MHNPLRSEAIMHTDAQVRKTEGRLSREDQRRIGVILQRGYDEVNHFVVRQRRAEPSNVPQMCLQTERIKAAVIEVVEDLADQDGGRPERATTHDPEAAAAVERPDDAIPALPVVKKEDLAPEWQADTPVLCAAGRGPLDEGAALMLAQLLEKHGLGARVEGAEAIARSNIFRLETSGLAMVCLSYFDANSAAHMRYTIRRIRRRLPQVRIVLGCWKSDAVATSLREAVKLCLSEAHKSQELPRSALQHAAASADAA
jgi:hypothetical protein